MLTKSNAKQEMYSSLKKVEEIEEQLGKITKAKIDPTSRLTNKIQKKLCQLIKKNKFTKKTNFELYFEPIPPRLYATIKADK